MLLVDKVLKGSEGLSEEPPQSVSEFLHSRPSAQLQTDLLSLRYVKSPQHLGFVTRPMALFL